MVELLNIKQAALYLQKGQILAMPTDTVYGLAVDSSNKQAIEDLYNYKHRDINKTLALVCGSVQQIIKYAEVTTRQESIIAKLLPGALTIILDKKRDVELNSHCFKNNKVAFRIPNKLELLELCLQINSPLALTSANISGGISAKTKEELIMQFNDIAILQAKEPEIKVESTIIDITQNKIKLIREGAVSKAELVELLNEEIL